MEKELTCLRSIIADCDERITAALKTRMECIEGIITYKSCLLYTSDAADD